MGIRVAAVLVAVAVIIAGLLLLGTQNNNTPGSHGGAPNSPTAGSRRGSANPVATNQVAIKNFTFSPAAITVKQGAKVSWTNQDSTAHTVTENDGQHGPSAPPLNPGQTYSFSFKKTGVFRYHCAIHPEMTGSVTVIQ